MQRQRLEAFLFDLDLELVDFGVALADRPGEFLVAVEHRADGHLQLVLDDRREREDAFFDLVDFAFEMDGHRVLPFVSGGSRSPEPG